MAGLGDLIVNEAHDAAHAAGTSTRNLMSYEDPHVRLLRLFQRAVTGQTGRGVFKNADQRLHVMVEDELGRDATGAVTQACVRFRILQARDDSVGKPAGCRRVGRRQVAVDAWTKPVRYASNGERRNRKPMARSLEADEPEWFGPEARHDEQIGARHE